MLTGEAGVGKSAMLDAAAERAGEALPARAVGEYEAELPFSGLHELLHRVLELVAELPSPQAAALRGALALSDEPVERFAVFAAVFGLLAPAAAEAPVLVSPTTPSGSTPPRWRRSGSRPAGGAERVGMLVAARDELPASMRAAAPGSPLDGLARDGDRHAARPRGRPAAQQNMVERVARAPHGNPLARWRSPPPSATTGSRAGSGSASRCRPGA